MIDCASCPTFVSSNNEFSLYQWNWEMVTLRTLQICSKDFQHKLLVKMQLCELFIYMYAAQYKEGKQQAL